MTTDERDSSFAARIQSAIATVEAWDDDPTLLAECRLMIPFADLVPELHGTTTGAVSPYAREDDCLYSGDVLLVKRLAVHFQKDVMTWVNAPPCHLCQSIEHMKHQETRAAETLEEKEGQARRVEVYQCTSGECDNAITTFPRYNSCRKLLETRQGRCGEYANLFGLYCRAVGLETRYVSDWTDHVWTEVYAPTAGQWMMVDSCEGTINAPSMYEHGWGKKLNCIVATCLTDGVTDVTPRYTRQFHTDEFQARRREIASSEAQMASIIRQYTSKMRLSLNAKAKEALEKRDHMERLQLDAWKNATEWTDSEKHGRGRISGSLEWRLQRKEAGNLRGTNNKESSSFVRALHCEQFYPTTSTTVCLEVSATTGITINKVVGPCDTQTPHSVSVVVVDDVHLGCLLQSRSFSLWVDVADFLQTIPVGRIVAMKGHTKEETWDANSIKQIMETVLGGFQMPDKPTEGVLFLGRVGETPEWMAQASYTTSAATKECETISVEFSYSTARSPTKLRREPSTVPPKVIGRVPESTMPLQTQLVASEAQKRAAFLSYVKDHADNAIGYTTRESSPIYLMDNSSFPFQEAPGNSNWSTFHYLPEVLVPDDDDVGVNGTATGNPSSNDIPKFDLPLEDNLFQSLLGPTLLVQGGGAAVPTSDALRHSRLVGLYFSAHWCPPCKRFTPMLVEMYNMLKEQHAYHGLEMVFVTSDRSQAEFQQYYATMPWKAVPFDETRMLTQAISMRFGVRGIPALVILDAVSGQVVSSIEQARNEVSQACSRGDAAIEDLFEKNWMQRIPMESRELFDLLELSSREGEEDSNNPKEEDGKPGDEKQRNAYLSKQQLNNPWADESSKPTLQKLELVTGTQAVPKEESNGTAPKMPTSDVKVVLTTMLKYLDNAVKTPWNPKFRQFKLSNKIVDKATRLEGAIDLICSFGMAVVPTAEDFMVSIPLGCDLDRMQSAMTNALKESE